MTGKKPGEGTSTSHCQKKVFTTDKIIDVAKIPEPSMPVDNTAKRKESTKIAPEKVRKKILTISLAKKKKEKCVIDIHVYSVDKEC